MTTNTYIGGPSEPSPIAYTVTPDDDTDLPFLPRGIYVNTGGTLVLQEYDHEGVRQTNTYNVFAGAILPFRPIRVMETGTDAQVVVRG